MKIVLTALTLLVLSTPLHAQVFVNGRQQLDVDLNDPVAFANAWNQVNTNPSQPFTLVLNATEVNPNDDPLNFKDPLNLLGDVLILPGGGLQSDDSFSIDSTTDPIFAVGSGGRLGIHDIGVGPSDAGGVAVGNGGLFHGQNVVFHGNATAGSGAGLSCGFNSECACEGCQFDDNHADQYGGAFSCGSGAECTFDRTAFINNSAGIFGCDGDVNGGNVILNGGFSTQNRPACGNVRYEVPSGNVLWGDYFFLSGPGHDAIDCTGTCDLHNTLVSIEPGPGQQVQSNKEPGRTKGSSDSLQSQCNDFGSGAFTSLGYNMDSDGSCFLNQPTDLPNTDPMVVVDANGIPQPQSGSPAIESGPVDLVNNELPCRYRDMNGLGRPQDFDLDGVFTCDRGPVEVQGGPDIGAPQSAAFFDRDRNGEGAFVEILENGRAVISFYTYSPDGTQMAWFVGSGQVVGNSIVVDELQKATGGVFGAGFDPEQIIRTRVGGMSLIFPDCEAIDNPGILNFTAEPDSGFENLLNKTYRLSSIFNCDGTPPAANANRSGAFFAPERSGEGIFVQWLSDGRVLIVFYTFDPAGNPFWVTSVVDNTAVNGNTVTAEMLYAEGKTKFGADFDPTEVMLSPWGTITLTYADKNNLSFAYDSSVAGFGAGTHAYTRLTQLLGAE